MNADKTNKCTLCGETTDSRIEIIHHVQEEHTITERNTALVERVWVEDTNA